ncbi:MAG: ABC transporter permease [Pseudolysinimonas sp.]
MTTETLTARRPGGTPISRITRIVKLNLTNPWTTIILPWLIIFAIFALSYGIWLIILRNASNVEDASEGMQYSGASSWIFVYMMVIAVQSMNLTFPLALGYGVTRRDFYLGSALTFALLSAMYAVGLTILASIEDATNGWGIGGRMFTAIYFGGADAQWWERLLTFFFLLLVFFFVGASVATLYVRWKANGLVAFFLALGILLVGGVALLSYTESWGLVGDFLAANQALGTAAWLLVPAAMAGIAGFFVLRRATPRS